MYADQSGGAYTPLFYTVSAGLSNRKNRAKRERRSFCSQLIGQRGKVRQRQLLGPHQLAPAQRGDRGGDLRLWQ